VKKIVIASNNAGKLRELSARYRTAARDADAAGLEAARLNLENELNRITARAYEMADHGGGQTP